MCVYGFQFSVGADTIYIYYTLTGNSEAVFKATSLKAIGTFSGSLPWLDSPSIARIRREPSRHAWPYVETWMWGWVSKKMGGTHPYTQVISFPHQQSNSLTDLGTRESQTPPSPQVSLWGKCYLYGDRLR